MPSPVCYAHRLVALADYDRQRQRDNNFLASIALDPELASETSDEVTRDVQSETSAAHGLIPAQPGAPTLPPALIPMEGKLVAPGSHANKHKVIIRLVGSNFDIAVRMRVLQGIFQQIHEYLRQPAMVTPNEGQIGIHFLYHAVTGSIRVSTWVSTSLTASASIFGG